MSPPWSRGDQDQPGSGILARSSAGRDHPEDHPGHDRRPAGHLHQAGRPAPQPPNTQVPAARTSRSRIAAETLEIYAPIANRLGMGRIKAELEDLAFRYVDPEEYFRIAALVEPGARRPRPSSGRVPKARSNELMKENRIPAEIEGRIKRLYSIYDKMKKPADRIRPGLRFHGPADHHRHGQELLRRAGHHPSEAGRPSPTVSAISSPCPSPTSTRPCTRPSSPRTSRVSRSRSGRRTCTPWPRTGSPPTGDTRTRTPRAW